MSIHIITKSGFELDFDTARLDNMELVDALAESADSNPIAISRTCLLMLGKEVRSCLYNHLRTPEGTVPVEKVSETIVEILDAVGAQGKNS